MSEPFAQRELELRLSLHEALCAERHEQLQRMLEESQKEIKELRQLASMGSGVWKAVIGLGVLLTILFTALKIFILALSRQ